MTPEQQDIVKRIRASASAIQRAVERAPASWQTQSPREGEWSVQEVLTHTLNADLFAFGVRIRRALVESNPQFTDYNEGEHRATLGPLLPVADLLQMLVAEHELLAHLLSNLPEAAWQRAGQHERYGKRTVELIARLMVEHDEEHAAQLERMAKG